MPQRTWAIAILIFLLLLTALACTVPGLRPSTPAATPTPLGDTLTFNIPTYTYNLEPNSFVPGTGLRYIGRSDDAFQVSIDGLPATKRIGDSFLWNGLLAPGVFANYHLRLTTAVLGVLPVVGPVEIIVLNPQPIEQPITAEPPNALHFGNVIINYAIPAGYPLPGTTIVYSGLVTQSDGTRLAQLSGLGGYPYLAFGDSLVWTGRLRNNVVVRYNLRAARIDDNGLNLAGTADLWISQ
jgi:hypothetical protein